MIDTKKYEGHTPAPWEVNNPDDDESLIFSVGALKFVSSANTRLIADAPLLLQEVKRLRDHIRRMRHWAEPKMHEVHHDAWRKLHEEIYEGDD